jgi:hypothetical protein
MVSTMTQRGGRRPNSGRKKGQYSQKTLDAMKVKQEYQDNVRKVADKLFQKQLSMAMGAQYLFHIPAGSKRAVMVTDPDTIRQFLIENDEPTGFIKNRGGQYFFMTTSAPDRQVISEMLDRAMGKATEHIDLTSKDEKIERPIILGEIKARGSGSQT